MTKPTQNVWRSIHGVKVIIIRRDRKDLENAIMKALRQKNTVTREEALSDDNVSRKGDEQGRGAGTLQGLMRTEPAS